MACVGCIHLPSACKKEKKRDDLVFHRGPNTFESLDRFGGNLFYSPFLSLQIISDSQLIDYFITEYIYGRTAAGASDRAAKHGRRLGICLVCFTMRCQVPRSHDWTTVHV